MNILHRFLTTLAILIVMGQITANVKDGSSQSVLYNLPSEEKLIEKYTLKDPQLLRQAASVMREYIENIGCRQAESCFAFGKKRPSSDQFISLGEGHSLVINHIHMPDYIFKFDHALERIQGLEVIKQAIADLETPYSVIMPDKHLILVRVTANMYALVLMAKKLDLAAQDLFEVLQQASPDMQSQLAATKQVVMDAGYCDVHPGNIKPLTNNSFAIIDTDLHYFNHQSDCGIKRFMQLEAIARENAVNPRYSDSCYDSYYDAYPMSRCSNTSHGSSYSYCSDSYSPCSHIDGAYYAQDECSHSDSSASSSSSDSPTENSLKRRVEHHFVGLAQAFIKLIMRRI